MKTIRTATTASKTKDDDSFGRFMRAPAAMSVLSPKADIPRHHLDVRFGPLWVASCRDIIRGAAAFPPESYRDSHRPACPLWANSGLVHCNIIGEAQTERPPRGGLSEIRLRAFLRRLR